MIKKLKAWWNEINDPFAVAPDPAPAVDTPTSAMLRRECVARSAHVQDYVDDIARDTFSTLTSALKGMEERMNGLEDQFSDLLAKLEPQAKTPAKPKRRAF